MEQAFNTVKQLVEDFKAQEAAFLSSEYQESHVRSDFIDKFFAALGWDVTHTQQKNPYQQEVKLENRVRVEGSQRFADYAFFTAPNFRDVKFFVEAKKPAHDLRNPGYYHQAIRYGWNQKTPIAILTDFEEFHILDCRYKPDIKTVLDRKIEVFRYAQYADEEIFKKIFFLFGRDAVAGGSIEKYTETLPKPRGRAKQTASLKGGYQQVDEAFLELLDGHRETLARAFKNKNPELDGEALTEAVQRTLDRLVFIRFLEDKGIEDPAIIDYRYQPSAWNAFVRHCRSLEPKYNGLVFKEHPVIDASHFIPPDDETFADICDELADPTSPYDFNSIPISILGSIYERFLGKVVTTTDKRAKVIEKPEVRKAGGVYYTPSYIVRYIVRETLGKLLYKEDTVIARSDTDGVGRTTKQSDLSGESRIASPAPKDERDRNDSSSFRLTPAEVAKLKIIDIACGSGSFLLEVYNTLLEYHAHYYAEHPDKIKKGDTATREGKLTLSHKKRKEILVNNIYGVDIDAQATEVTQLSLYLKLMEEATLNDSHQFSLLKERMLPELKRNIICGNSLIGRDILEGKLFDDSADHALKPMNFEDAFPEIMSKGGFDVVVGNPPYVRIQGFPQEQIKYFHDKYLTAWKNFDLYTIFIEKGYRLLSPDGLFGMILPNKFFKTDYGEKLRKLLIEKKAIQKIIDFGANQVFDVTTYTCLLFLSKKAKKSFDVAISKASPAELLAITVRQMDFSQLDLAGWSLADDKQDQLKKKVSQHSVRLLDLPAEMSRGSSSGDDKIFMLDSKDIELEREMLRTPIFATDFERYKFNISGEWNIIFPYHIERDTAKLLSETEISQRFPKTYNYLISHKSELNKRKQFKEWFGYSAPRNLNLHEHAHILIPLLADKGSYALLPKDSLGKYCIMASGGFSITLLPECKSSPQYVLGLLNSKLLFWCLKNLSNVFRGGWITCTKQYFGELPIRTINFGDPADKARHDNIVALVEQMLSAKEKYAAAKTEAEKNRLEMQTESLDRRIDAAVYELYGLTEEEIGIVEGK